MKSVSITVRTKKQAIDKVWDLLTDIEKYPKRVKYVKKVTVYGTSEGSVWDDTTTILWVPMKMKHTITTLRKNKEYSFDIPLYFGGVMKQKYVLRQEDRESVIIKASITYTLGNRFFNQTIGKLLNKRLKNMLESTVQFVDGEVL